VEREFLLLNGEFPVGGLADRGHVSWSLGFFTRKALCCWGFFAVFPSNLLLRGEGKGGFLRSRKERRDEELLSSLFTEGWGRGTVFLGGSFSGAGLRRKKREKMLGEYS